MHQFLFELGYMLFLLFVWLTGLGLTTALLFQSLRTRLLWKYPYFASYLGFILISSWYLLCVFFWRPEHYGKSYWPTEFTSSVLGFLVLIEIYRGIRAYFLGVGRLILQTQCSILAANLAWALITKPWVSGGMIELERDLRAIQAGLLIGFLAVVGWYEVPLGGNLLGMIGGYGLLVSTNLIILAFRSF